MVLLNLNLFLFFNCVLLYAVYVLFPSFIFLFKTPQYTPHPHPCLTSTPKLLIPVGGDVGLFGEGDWWVWVGVSMRVEELQRGTGHSAWRGGDVAGGQRGTWSSGREVLARRKGVALGMGGFNHDYGLRL